MSLNFEQEGIPIAKIKDGGGKKKKDKEVYLDENSSARNNYPELKIPPGSPEKFQFVPDENKERVISYCVGQSGSGKSYWAAQLMEEYKKQHPKNPIYLLSYLASDSTIDKVKGVQRIKLDETFLETDLTAEDFENSLTVWDDTDCIKEKKMKTKLRELLEKLLNVGRHTNTSVIYLSHIACKGLDTQAILNECHSLTFFPSSLGGRTRSYLLGQYMGFNKKQIEAVDNVEGRSITVVKSYPMVLVSDKLICPVKNFGKS